MGVLSFEHFQNHPDFIILSFIAPLSALLECLFHSGSSQIHSASLLLVLSVFSLASMGRLSELISWRSGSDSLFYRGLGVIPIFLSEISPPAFRSTFPGVAYQLGNMVSSASAQIESS